MIHKRGDRLSVILISIVVGVEHLDKCPLRPLVVLRIAGHDHSTPVVREADVVQLFPVPVGIDLGGDGRMLSRLDRILLRRQTIGIISHRVQDIESAEPLVPTQYVRGNVAERMPHMETGSRGIREHIQAVKLLLRWLLRDLVYIVVSPPGLPLFLYLCEVVGHKATLLVCLTILLRAKIPKK